MTHNNIFLFCFSIILFIVIISENLNAQSNSQQTNIPDKAIDKYSSDPVLVQIPGGYRVEVESNPLINKNQTALEVIRAVPGVFIMDSIIEVAGRKDLLLQINGIDMKMDISHVVDYLLTISGDNIREVEVIRNPTAVFNSRVGCVLNLITKNQHLERSFEKVRASIGNLNKGFIGTDLFIVKPKYDLSVSLADNYNKSFNSSDYIERYVILKTNYSQTITNPKIVLNNPFVNLNYSYKINDNQIIGSSFEYWGNSFSSINSTSQSTDAYSKTKSVQTTKKYYDKGSFGIYSNLKFKNRSRLDLLLNSTINNTNDRYKKYNIDVFTNLSDQSSNQEEKYLSQVQTLTFKAIYKSNISKKILFECGTELIYSKFSNQFHDSVCGNLVGINIKYTDLNNNYLTYYEYSASTFLNLNFSFKKLSYTLGLRDEYCLYNFSSRYDGNELGNSFGGQLWGKIKGNYLYPNTSVSYKFNEKHLLTISFKQVNTRPGLILVQPYVYDFTADLFSTIKDPVSFKTSMADLSYIIQPSQNQMYMLNGGISYSGYSSNSLINDVVVISLFRLNNIERKTYVSFSTHNVISKSFSLGSSFYVVDIDNSVKNTVLNFMAKISPCIVFNINGNIHIPEKFNFIVNYQYNSAIKTPHVKIFESHYLNLVFNRSFLKNKIETFLSISNPYYPIKRVEGYSNEVRQYNTSSEAAVFRIGASYKFGKSRASN